MVRVLQNYFRTITLIEWHKLDQLGFDWKVGNLLYRLKVEEDKNYSIRYMRWCVRIVAARPDAPISFVEKIAEQCVIDDHAELLGLSKLDRGEVWNKLFKAKFDHRGRRIAG